jgi:hypothetical protein
LYQEIVQKVITVLDFLYLYSDYINVTSKNV